MTEKLTRKTRKAVIVTALVLLIALVCSLSDAYAAGVADATGKVNAPKGVVLRASASNKGRRVATLNNNSNLILKKEVFTKRSSSAKKNRWYLVRTSSGKTGYIRSDKVKNISYTITKATAKGKVFCRKGAGNAQTYKSKYTAGKTINIVLTAKAAGSKKTWYKVKKGSKYYFISSNNVKIGAAAAKKTTTTATAKTPVSSSSEVPKIKNVKTETSKRSMNGIDFTLSEIRYPETIYEGRAFGVTGLVIASRRMEKMEVGVQDTNGKWLVSGSTNPEGVTGNIFLLDKYVKFGALKPGTYVYAVEVTIDGKKMTPISRKFKIEKAKNAELIVNKAIELAWPDGTSSSKYKYPQGYATDSYKKALEQAFGSRKGWGDATKKGASCDVFLSTVLRTTGVAPDCPRGLQELFPYFANSSKFQRVDYDGKISTLRSGDIIIYYHSNGAHCCIYFNKNGKDYIAEANHNSTYGMITSRSADLRDRTKATSKKYIYRVVD